MSILTLLTDFGTTDYYVAAVKGTILARAPEATLVDLGHDLPSGDIAAGAYLLGAAAPNFPPGTIHLAVVDPGVGSERRILAVETAAGTFMGPDNGLLTPALQPAFWPGGAKLAAGAVRVVAVEGPDLWSEGPAETGPRARGATFHGRDRFAPVAAWLLSRGSAADIAELGPEVHDALTLPAEAPRKSEQGTQGTVHGHIAHVDRYGNLITNVPSDWLPPLAGSEESPAVQVTAKVDNHQTRLRVSYFAELAAGEAAFLPGSLGTLELVANGASLARRWQVDRGALVTVSW